MTLLPPAIFETTTILTVLFVTLVRSSSASLLESNSSSTSSSSLPASSDCSSQSDIFRFGAAFLSNAGQSQARGPLTMILPKDSSFSMKTRQRRHVVCGKTSKNSRRKSEDRPMSHEQRAVCPYRHVMNRNEMRIPAVLEEVRCECERPSHLSPYTDIRCEPVKYRMPVLLKNPETGQWQQDHQELTLACIPVAPKSDDSTFELHQLT